MTDKLLIFWLALVVFCSRLPFLTPGYGNDSDAWRVVNAAQHLATTGEYIASRLPGYPLPELLYSLLWKRGPVVLNGITALLSTIGVVFFVLILKRVGSLSYGLGGLALAFCPVFFINSTNSMDYVWALTFILAATYFMLINRFLLGAIFLGLAIGSRITSGAMLLPLSLLLIHAKGKVTMKSLIHFALVACLIGAIFFVPVFLRYGLDFFSFWDSYPPLLWLVYSGTVVVWGAIGSLALGLIILDQIWHMRTCELSGIRALAAEEQWLLVAWVLPIVLYITAFLRLPHDGAYLLPVVPFVLLLLDRFLTRTRFMLVCLALVLSSFAFTVERTEVLLPGPIFQDHQERLEKSAYLDKYVAIAGELNHKSIVIAGQWLPAIMVTLPPNPNPLVEFVQFLSKSDLQIYMAQGFQPYYLAGQRQFTQEIHGYDPAELGALPFDPGDDQTVKL